MAKVITDAQDNFELVKLKLDGRDIRNDYVAISIYENIFENDITLSMDFVEIENILEVSPVIEGALLEIEYFSKYPPAIPEMGSFVMDFECYKTERVKSTTQGKKGYRLHFVTKEQHNQSMKLVSRPYRDKTSTEIIESLFGFSDPCVPLNIELSDDFIPLFAVPQWSPWKTINYVCKDALKFNKNDYIFFRDAEEYVCKPISILMQQGPIITYKMDQMAIEWEYDKDTEYRTIVSYHQDKANFNSLDSINSGYYGSRFHRYNALTKLHEWFEYIGKDTEFSGIDNKHVYDCDNYYNREAIADYRQDRLSKMIEINDERMVVRVRTNTEITVGKTIMLEIPTTKRDSILNPSVVKELDTRTSGKYLISKLRHQIVPSDSKMVFEAIKVP